MLVSVCAKVCVCVCVCVCVSALIDNVQLTGALFREQVMFYLLGCEESIFANSSSRRDRSLLRQSAEAG